MIHVMVRCRVKGYPHWKKVFDEAEAFRRDRGETSYDLYRPAHDDHEVVILFRWDEMGVARDFFDSRELGRLWNEAGVQGTPEVTFLKLVDRGEAFGRRR